ncbi:DUF454 family protein [Catenisphaera adipataccumulans]|jgi:uncharacterized membrane protein YbaN (DUF454 family)|uniref:DUF454 domain-containing protein n=1 Tax=Catenisphaera adipataccumulans TaxID=700500 RepID=A0A7W8CWA0_9FIRM|nr:DUF454 family protein [Catenisphaera adipataccumulans]MBB5182758.1 hypothetical protein [Catenisphaera adipataccumulans]
MGQTIRKALWLTAGSFFLVLGLIGLAIPIIPQVPFLLASAFCFSKGSERFNKKMKESRLYHWIMKKLHRS